MAATRGRLVQFVDQIDILFWKKQIFMPHFCPDSCPARNATPLEPPRSANPVMTDERSFPSKEVDATALLALPPSRSFASCEVDATAPTPVPRFFCRFFCGNQSCHYPVSVPSSFSAPIALCPSPRLAGAVPHGSLQVSMSGGHFSQFPRSHAGIRRQNPHPAPALAPARGNGGYTRSNPHCSQYWRIASIPASSRARSVSVTAARGT